MTIVMSALMNLKRDLPGYAIGGVSVGEGPELMEKIVKILSKMPPINQDTLWVLEIQRIFNDLEMVWYVRLYHSN